MTQSTKRYQVLVQSFVKKPASKEFGSSFDHFVYFHRNDTSL